tara:strand:- start:3501 stop:5738 length:2238 start_codon:yes stop_codon:yes gene_type:complete
MIFGLLVLITALTISAVAIYYSIAGLVAIFAAAALPIMVMGGALEVGKLVTAVWLHRYWHKAKWWLRWYLALAVVILMFITSMGIFGFLSKAHIEQTTASQESVEQIARLETEISRQRSIIDRAEEKINKAENSTSNLNDDINAQIEKEQKRIDNAYTRIQPAIDEQQKIIADARESDAGRTKPYEDQLTNIKDEIIRLETSAKEYEETIANLDVDTSAIVPIQEQISTINNTISKVEGQIASGESEQIKQAQLTIGANADGQAGPNTRRSANTWIGLQKERITELQNQIAQLRIEAKATVDAERDRLSGVVKDIREKQIPALKDREMQMLTKIDEVRATESPIITTARNEIARIRASADDQVKASQELIQKLREKIKVEGGEDIDSIIDEQSARIKKANNEIDTLTEEKYSIEAEYRKLEAEVGPIKYIAEFIYAEADRDILEQAVRWVIMTIIFVFDPLAVLLLIASQYTFEYAKSNRKKDFDEEWKEYEQLRAQRIVQNSAKSEEDEDGRILDTSRNVREDEDTAETKVQGTVDNDNDSGGDEDSGATIGTADNGGDSPERVVRGQEQIDESKQEEAETDDQSPNPFAKDFFTEEETVNDTRDTDTTVQTPTDDGQNIGDEQRNDLQDINVADDERDGKASDEADIQSREGVEKVKEQVPDNLSEEQTERLNRYEKEEKENSAWAEAKRKWKAENPEEMIKKAKLDYILGRTSVLPWEDTYIQNSEQSNESLWNKIKNNEQD